MIFTGENLALWKHLTTGNHAIQAKAEAITVVVPRGTQQTFRKWHIPETD